jgi:Flp pilus assembly protein TadG
MSWSQAARLGSCERGSSAVERAIVAPAFFWLVFGIIFVGMILWTQASLHFAAQSAARCAAINTGACNSSTTIQNYALSRYYGLSTSS